MRQLSNSSIFVICPMLIVDKVLECMIRKLFPVMVRTLLLPLRFDWFITLLLGIHDLIGLSLRIPGFLLKVWEHNHSSLRLCVLAYYH